MIVIEHDEETIRSADYLVDMGPGAGVHGGKVVAIGSPEDIINSEQSLTGKYLSGKLKIELPSHRRKPIGYIEVTGAQENNLKRLAINLPLGVLCGVTGVSGSGKSTLMNLTIMPVLRQMFGERVDKIGTHESLSLIHI